MKWKKEKETLEKYISEKLSYEEIGRKYNCTGSNIKKVCIRLGIELTRRRTINENETFNKGITRAEKCICKNCGKEFVKYKGSHGKFCSIPCQKEYEHKEKYNLIINGDVSIMRANYSPKHFKEDILEEQNHKCAICGCSEEHNGQPLIFIIDHIDGHAANNKRENLRCICPNCDSQLPTYKSKNKKSDRDYRYKPHSND